MDAKELKRKLEDAGVRTVDARRVPESEMVDARCPGCLRAFKVPHNMVSPTSVHWCCECGHKGPILEALVPQ